jgi:hypothetical protein
MSVLNENLYKYRNSYMLVLVGTIEYRTKYLKLKLWISNSSRMWFSSPMWWPPEVTCFERPSVQQTLNSQTQVAASRPLVPKVGCTVPWGAVGLPRGALEVGPSERVVRWYHFIKPIHRIKNLLTVK